MRTYSWKKYLFVASILTCTAWTRSGTGLFCLLFFSSNFYQISYDGLKSMIKNTIATANDVYKQLISVDPIYDSIDFILHY